MTVPLYHNPFISGRDGILMCYRFHNLWGFNAIMRELRIGIESDIELMPTRGLLC